MDYRKVKVRDEFLNDVIKDCYDWVLCRENKEISFKGYNGKKIKVLTNTSNDSLLLVGKWPDICSNPYSLSLLPNINEYPIKRVFIHRSNNVNLVKLYMATYSHLHAKCLHKRCFPLKRRACDNIELLASKNGLPVSHRS